MADGSELLPTAPIRVKTEAVAGKEINGIGETEMEIREYMNPYAEMVCKAVEEL